MDHVTRLFRLLVTVLADADPAQLRQPFRIAELHERILPYRRFKRDLKFDAIEDYEMAMLRLLAGDGGYVSVEPEEVQEAIAVEVDAVNPDTGAYRAFGDATVQLDPRRVQAVLTRDAAYAPPTFPLPGAVSPDEAGAPEGGRLVFEALEDERHTEEPAISNASPSRPRCSLCQAELPGGQAVTFCPFCGHRLELERCAGCDERIEAGWLFCGACGRPVG